MRRIEKKIWPEFFKAVQSGSKRWELRLADFDAQPGDTLVLREWDPASKAYTGQQIEKRVGYVGRFSFNELTRFWPKEQIEAHGLQILSLE